MSDQSQDRSLDEELTELSEKVVTHGSYLMAPNLLKLQKILSAPSQHDERLFIVLSRYRHLAMLGRMIGNRPGMGGLRDVKHLSATLSKRLLPEIWDSKNHRGDHNTNANRKAKASA